MTIVVLMAGCTQSQPQLSPVVIGVRDGQLDRVRPVPHITKGTAVDLAASTFAQESGWIVATWTYWPADRTLPRDVGSHLFNVSTPKTVFTALPWTTLGPWPPGHVTCVFKTATGQSQAASVAVIDPATDHNP